MRIVENNEALAAFLAELSGAPYLALDTEFLRDQTYYPKLCLIQVAARRAVEGIIDPLAPGIDLKPFYELIARPDIVKVLHAARQDIEIFLPAGRRAAQSAVRQPDRRGWCAALSDAASYEDAGAQDRPCRNRQVRPLHRLEPSSALQASTGIRPGRCHPSLRHL